LINLVGVGLLDLLPGLFSTVLIPEEVSQEYAAGKAPSDPNLDVQPWLKVMVGVHRDPALPAQLGEGEAAALSLALAQNARAVLLDEAFGRRIAQKWGLPVVGTLSILLAAKQAGLLPAVGPVVDRMIHQGRRISPQLRAEVLRAAGE
jgi:predicted nucleic acid-binding protein